MKKITLLSLFLVLLGSGASVLAQISNSIVAVIDPIGFIKAGPSENSATLLMLDRGDSLVVSTEFYTSPYFKVKHGTIEGYVSVACLALECDVLEIIFSHTKRDYRAGCDGSKPFLNDNPRPGAVVREPRATSDCASTANCGCSGKRKAECGGSCCKWIVGTGCVCR